MDISAFILSSLLLVVDGNQTLQIAQQGRETNFALGDNPSKKKVYAYFGTALAANSLVFLVPKKKDRTLIWSIVSGFQAGVVGNNYNIGIGYKF